jgi:sortase A
VRTGSAIWRLGLGLLLSALSTGAGLVAFLPRGEAITRTAAERVLVAATVTAPPAPTPPTTAAPTLSQPQPLPSDAYAAVPVVAVGSIAIPKIGLDLPVYEGVWQTVLDVGPGHWPGTAPLGGYGNTVIAGHRVTYGGPFRHLDALAVGDAIRVSSPAGRFTYAVTGTTVVTPATVQILDQRPGHTITLFTCHPPGQSTYRYVVFGQLVSAAPPA